MPECIAAYEELFISNPNYFQNKLNLGNVYTIEIEFMRTIWCLFVANCQRHPFTTGSIEVFWFMCSRDTSINFFIPLFASWKQTIFHFLYFCVLDFRSVHFKRKRARKAVNPHRITLSFSSRLSYKIDIELNCVQFPKVKLYFFLVLKMEKLHVWTFR